MTEKRYRCPRCKQYIEPHCESPGCVWLLCKTCILTFRQLTDGTWNGARLRKSTFNV